MNFGTKKTFERLEKMLDDGINGTFRESDYDESELSKLETKWLRYLTSSRLSHQKIEQERANIKELVTDISHQTKTALSNITLYTQLLQEQDLDGQSMEIACQIRKSSQKLEFLMQALVKLSRMESGTFRLEPQKNDVSALITSAVEQIKKNAEQKRLQIVFTPISDCFAAFDMKWTREAVFNILDNAVKYTPDNGRVLIELKRYEMFTCIEISDSGSGIAEDELPQIFSRFYRGSNVREMDGIGVGLYLSREIITAQNGYIKADSKLGCGSTFQIFLPNP